MLDRLAIRASVLLNAAVCARYPQISDAGRERNWAWLAHGRYNSTLHTAMDAQRERDHLTVVMRTIEQATGRSPRSWLGPALTETPHTHQLLRELGYTYLLDWVNDDQPYPLTIDGMISVPYSAEFNDPPLFTARNLSGPPYVRLVVDALSQPLHDGESGGRVLALPLHPFIVNQSSRHRYLAEALEHVAGHPGVWVTTSDEVAAHYLKHHDVEARRPSLHAASHDRS